MELPCFFFHLAVGQRDSIMLAQVFSPIFNEKAFDVPIAGRRHLEKCPSGSRHRAAEFFPWRA